MAAYVVITTFAYSPAISFRTARDKAGTIARRDVVASRDFILPDEDAAQRRRAEAREQVLPEYDSDSQAAARLEEDLHQFFHDIRQPSGRHPAGIGRGGERAVLVASRSTLGVLAKFHFSSDIESKLIAVEARLYRVGLVDNKEIFLQNRDRGVVVRDVQTGAEHRTLDLFRVVEYGADAKAAVASELASASLPAADRKELAEFLVSSMRPNLTLNAAETARRRDEAARRVESVLVKIPRGEVIVRAGDPVTPRTAEIIALVQGSASEPQAWWKLLGVLALQVLAALVFRADAEVRRRNLRQEGSGLLAILTIGVVFAVGIRLAFVVIQALASSVSSEAFSASSYAIPFAAGPILVVLVSGGAGPAVLFAAIGAVEAGILMGMSYPFALFVLIGSLAGIFGLKQLRSRAVLVTMAGIVVAANAAAVSIGGAIQGRDLAGPLGPDVLGASIGGLLVAAVVAFLLPVFESVFHVTTDIRLLELSNQNLPLLRKLAFEAPGTYQHSLMLGHLAEAAAEAIGADPLLARVCAYYHDIGKTRMPEYFIENQPKGQNRHDRLEPSMSALIIASHVKDGAELAKRNRLPDPIVTGIREHHGTKLIRYFYQKALTRVRPDSAPILESDYRYPGPKPSNRVTGILMIADAVEAASRTIMEPTPAKFASMVRAITSDCLRDGQFDECDLTMRDLTAVNDALIRTVNTMFHHRIDYPGFDFNREKSEKRTARRSTGGVRLSAK